MRALIVALAMAGVAGVAQAQMNAGMTGGEIPVQAPKPTIPSGVRKQAEDAVKAGLGEAASVGFRAVKVLEAATVKHGAFGEAIEGPVSVVCGQYGWPERKAGANGYSWFFVAIKRGHVLWTASDETSNTPDEAYDSCKGAGLAE